MIKKEEMITETIIKEVQEITTSKGPTVKETTEDKEDNVKEETEKVDIIREMTLIMKAVSNATMRTPDPMNANSDRTRVVVEEADSKERKNILEIPTTCVRSTTHKKSTQSQTTGSIIATTRISLPR